MYQINVDGYPEQYKDDIYWPWIAISEEKEGIIHEVVKGIESLVITARHHNVANMDIKVSWYLTDVGYPVALEGFNLRYSKI